MLVGMTTARDGVAADAGRGRVAGVVATAGMSVLMLAARRAGLLGRMPPEKITARTLDRLGVRRGRRTQDLLATLMHLGFGASAGALFEVARRRARVPLPVVLQGVAYGTAVWAVSYYGWLPALGIMAPPHRDRPGRPQTMLAAHWLYGGLLAALAIGALLVWLLMDVFFTKRATVSGMLNGMIAGLVAITPAAGYVNGYGALIIGVVAGTLP